MNNEKSLCYYRLSRIYEMVIIAWIMAIYFITYYGEFLKIKTDLQIFDVFKLFEERLNKEKTYGEN